nr:hypothetical protein [Tanacetum cinerariifolium]
MHHVADEAVHKELGDSLVRAATTASRLGAKQNNDNIAKTQSKATPNESSSQRTDSGGGPRCQETIRDTTAQTRFESVSKHYNDSLPARGNTLQSDEDGMKLNELMALCTTLQNRVLELEKTKTSQHNEIASLKRRVEKLEKRNRSRTHKLRRLYKVGLTSRVESSDDEESLGKNDNVVNITTEELTLAQALEALKTSKPKVKWLVIQESDEKEVAIDAIPLAVKEDLKDLYKQVKARYGSTRLVDNMDYLLWSDLKTMFKPHVEDEVWKRKKGYKVLDEESAKRLQAEFDEKERLAREKAKKEQEANIALIETWDDIQAKIDDDHQLAERLQAQEKEE